MRNKVSIVVGSAAFLIFMSAGVAFSQDTAMQDEVTPETKNEPEAQWAWGEVISVDTQKNEILLKYLDYETDQEKQILVNVDDKTTYENVKSLSEIKPQDAAGVDYIVTLEGKNLAKNISLENPEANKTEGESVESAAPASSTPASVTGADAVTTAGPDTEETPKSEQ